MEIFEISLKLFLLNDIRAYDALEKTASLIDKSFLNSEIMKQKHYERTFKKYVFNTFYPIEKEVYKAGNIYTIKVRTVEKALATYFEANLEKIRTPDIQALTAITTKFHRKELLSKIYSITPAVCKLPGGYWRNEAGVEALEKRIKSNVVNKYIEIFKQEPGDFDLFKKIEIVNQKPIATKYKQIKILGDKIELELAENELAQVMGNIMLGCGLLEMNARGFGFVNAKFV